MLSSIVTPLLLLFAAGSTAQYLFHGTSVIITANDLMPRNATFETASFYCFATPTGYVTFGWWMGGDPEDIDIDPITPAPGPEEFHWFEYSVGKCNDIGVCRLKAFNFDIKRPEKPEFVEDYVIMPFQLGLSDQELMFLSYFDREHGKTAVGVRNILVGEECRQAYSTLKEIVEKHELPIKFDFTDPCIASTSYNFSPKDKQARLGSHSKLLDLARFRNMEI